LVLLSAGPGGCKREQTAPQAGPGPTSQPAAAELLLPEMDDSGLPMGLQMKVAAARREARRAPSDVSKVVDLGALCYAHGFPQVAVACFQQATRLEPGVLEWWYFLGLAEDRAGDAKQAISAYEKVLAINENYGPARTRLWALLLEKDRPRAEKMLRQALESDPKNAIAHFGLGRCALAAGRQEEAVEHIRATLKSAPNYGPAHAALAEVLSAQGKTEEAAQHRERATGDEQMRPLLDPLLASVLQRGLDLETLLASAATLAERRQFPEAEKLLQEALDVDPTGVQARTRLGEVLGRQGKVAEAVAEFERVLSTPEGQEYLPAKVNLAFALTLQEQYERAERLLREVLEKDPTEAEALRRFCMLATQQRAPDNAVPLLKAALAAAPESGPVHYQVGELLRQLGKPAEGLEVLRKAVELQPDLAPARFLLGRALFESGDQAGAGQQWSEALRSVPTYLEPRLALYRLRELEKDYAAAERTLRQGLEELPDSPDLANGLAWLLATCPDPARRNAAEAVQWAEKACQVTRHSHHLLVDTLAAAYAAAGRFEEARKWVAEAIRLAEAAGQNERVAEYQARQALYAADRPYYATE
jgi:tetratricopeptide (TPR) repeat protein